MWLESRLEWIRRHPGPLIFECGPNDGVYPIIGALGSTRQPLVWLELNPQDQDDPIAQANHLADALRQTFGSALLTHSLPYLYGLTVLRTQLPYLAPYTYTFTNAQYGADFAQEFLHLHTGGNRVILQFDELPSTFSSPEDALIICSKDLELTPEEAFRLADGRTRDDLTLKLLAIADNKHDTFLAELNHHLKHPPPLIPGPHGPRFAPGYEPQVEPAELLELLITEKRWEEALELTIDIFPERVPEVLTEAGHAFHERGMHKRLWDLLSPLPAKQKNNEVVLFWLLSCGFRIGCTDGVRRTLEMFLQSNEAPELRALYSGVYKDQDDTYKQAKRAYKASSTPFTTFQLGMQTLDIDQSVALLEKSVALAEQRGRGYEKVRNASALAERLILRGDYEEALNWCAWANKTFDENALSDSPRRLRIINNWAYTRLLRGDLAGLGELLTKHTSTLNLSYPNLARLFRSTLGDYFIAINKPGKALGHYRENIENCPRRNLGFAALSMVRGLLETDEKSEASTIAKRAYDLTKIDSSHVRAPAILAYGITLTNTSVQDAIPHLLKAREFFSQPLLSYRLAQANLYLARAYLLSGKEELAKETLYESQTLFDKLNTSGLRLLVGPEEDFKEIFDLIQGHNSMLEIRLSGSAEIWLEQKRIEMSPQQLELIAILGLKGRPLNVEELLSYLYGDGGKNASLVATMAKIRHKLPVSQHPYHITVPYNIDTQEIERALQVGQLEKAMRLFKGSIFPNTNSPFLREYAETLTESLRRAALNQPDVETLYQLSEHDQFREDMELLEATLKVLEKSDPRVALLQTRVHRLEITWDSLN